MQTDLELYRREVDVTTQPRVHLSVIDIAPELPQKTLVLIHGFGGQAIQWQHQLSHFGLAHRVIAIDLRGHGRSDKPSRPYTMPVILRDLEVALERLQVDGQIVLAGHSFGGAVVTEYALAHPQQVEHLILIATAGEFKLNWPSRTLFKLPLPMLRVIERFTRQWLHAPFHVLKPWYQNILAPWSGWTHFRSLTVPTLVIRGHRDFLFEKPFFEEVPKAIVGAEDIDVGASGHMVMLERRDAVNRAFERVLEGATTRSWRDAKGNDEATERSLLLRERPWLANYEQGVPFTIAAPRTGLPFLLRSAARRFAQQTAIQFAGTAISYQELNEWSNRFAHALHTLGVQPGERVMLLLPDLPQFIIAFYGALKAGAVVVLTPPQTERGELAAQINATAAQVLITVYELSEIALRMQSETPLQHLIFTRKDELAANRDGAAERPSTPTANVYHFSALLAKADTTEPTVAVAASDLALIQYTSGTTGVAKGVMLSHRNLLANTLQTRQWIANAQEGKERFLCAITFSHIYGLTTTLNLPIALGATLILEPDFDLARVLEAVKRYKPTVFPGVPGMYVALNNYPGIRNYGIESIKACICGSAPLPVEVQEGFEKLTKGRLVEGYGLTEAAPVTHANPLNGRRKVGSIGIPLPSTEAAIFDLASGEPVLEPGQIGELGVRGPQVMLGYWQQPEETAQVLRPDGWLLTGDVAQRDAEGYFRIIARKAEMWYPNRPSQPNSEPAFPRDIEEVLYEVPQIKEVAVVAIANQPIAFITAQTERPTPDALLAYCRRRLPPELVPRLIIFVEDFPRSFIGKILRKELVKRFEHLKNMREFAEE